MKPYLIIDYSNRIDGEDDLASAITRAIKQVQQGVSNGRMVLKVEKIILHKRDVNIFNSEEMP